MNYYNEHDAHAAAWLRELIKGKLIPDGVVDERDIQQITEADLVGFTQVHLFAGIGGWPYALRLAGWPEDRPVWTGSCPCQPYSTAGKGKGDADPRNLWPEMFRLIRQCRPVVCFGEQVESAIGRGWLDGISADLEAEGYAVGSVVLGAHSVGAPHIRQRLFWVADAGGAECGRRPESAGEHGGTLHTSNRCDDGGMGDPEFDNMGRHGGTAFGAKAEGDCGGEEHGACGIESGFTGAIGGLGNSDSPSTSRLGCVGLPLESKQETGRSYNANPWTGFETIRCADGKTRRVEPSIFPLAHGVSGRVALLRGAGNAISPQTAAAFIRAIRFCRKRTSLSRHFRRGDPTPVAPFTHDWRGGGFNDLRRGEEITMGMFDTIHCDYPLPGNPPEPNLLDWQTKSLDCGLDEYFITAKGAIEVEEYDIEDQSDPNAVGWRQAIGCMARVNKRRVPMPSFRGEIIFYATDKQAKWWEYSAIFDEGKLLNIKLIQGIEG